MFEQVPSEPLRYLCGRTAADEWVEDMVGEVCVFDDKRIEVELNYSDLVERVLTTGE